MFIFLHTKIKEFQNVQKKIVNNMKQPLVASGIDINNINFNLFQRFIILKTLLSVFQEYF